MKTAFVSKITLCMFFILFINCGTLYSIQNEIIVNDTIEGKWLGELPLPDLAKLRTGIVITKKDNNTYTAFLNIIDQATGDIPCNEVVYKNDSVLIRIAGLGIEIAGSLSPDLNSITCEFRQRGGVLPVVFTRVSKFPELLRPQEPKKPYPYNTEEVVYYNNKAGNKLAATLTFPKTNARVPAVILVTGSGQQNRDQEIGKHKPFWIIADHLTRNGIAVLRADDRGTGGSGGNFSFSTSYDFAMDALSGINYLKGRSEVDPGKIGIIGHSEGGMIAPLAAGISDDVAFFVSLAGVATSFEDVVIDQIMAQLKMQGKSEEEIEMEMAWRKKIYNVAAEDTDSLTATKELWRLYSELSEDNIKKMNWPRGRHEAQIQVVLNPWWRYALALDNRTVLMKVRCPMLALYGELDRQVDADKNIRIMEEALDMSGNKNYLVRKLPGLNHLFQTSITGSEYEYIRIEETFSPEALEIISGWILEHTRQ